MIEKASSFTNQTVDPLLKDPTKLRFEPDKLKVSGDGVFYTLQGEGVTMGKPAVFLRLHICNLQCTWCDAWYTWNKNTPEFWTESNNLTVDETIVRLTKTWQEGTELETPRVVVTGGEPMIQQKLIAELYGKHPEWDWEIETNGTIAPNDTILQNFQINCSPKLDNSKNRRELMYKPEVIRLINSAPNSWFKFVVMTEDDLKEIEKDYIETGLVDKSKVILMPQGVTNEEINKHALQVAEYAKLKGFRLLLRLQTALWGTRRRV